MYQQIKKGALALSLSLCCVGAFAQKTITGNVKDATGEPLIGVTMAHPINHGHGIEAQYFFYIKFKIFHS